MVVDLGRVPDQVPLELDFSALLRITPAGLALLTSTIIRWRREQRPLTLTGLSSCKITGYLQRMDFFKACGVEIPEHFRRHDATGRFMPLRLVEYPTEILGREMAACVAPGGDDYEHPLSWLYDMVFYVLTETANNVRQHSNGLGFACAQVNRQEGLVRLAIADNGKGIRRSFIDAGFSWAEPLDDAASIAQALSPRVSCKGSPTNEGVGLTLISEVARLSKAWMLLVSGTGVCQLSPSGDIKYNSLPENGIYHGTLCVLTFPQIMGQQFSEMLYEAKGHAGLLHMGGQSGRFSA